MARYWYSYIKPTSDPRLSSSYQLLRTGVRTPRCTIGNVLCAINAPAGGPFPFSPISANLQAYIAAALANGVPQPELPFGSKIFVYLKSS